MSPIEWAVLPLKKFAVFSGRAPRAEHWWFYLAYVLLAVILNILTDISSIFGILGFAFLVLVIPFLAVTVRRLHDTNRSGLWLLAPMAAYLVGVIIVGPALLTDPTALMASASFGLAGLAFLVGAVLAVVVFVFTLLPGTRGPNRYGPDPYSENTMIEGAHAE